MSDFEDSGNEGGGEAPEKLPTVLLLESDSEESSDSEASGDEGKSPGGKKKKGHSKKEKGDDEKKQKKKKEHIVPVPYLVPKILLQREFFGAELSEFTNIDCNGAPVILGFPSDGTSSVMVANFFIEELKLPLVGHIVVPTFPPSCRIHNGQPSYATRVYGDRRLIVVVSEYQNLDSEPESMHGIVACLFDFAKRHRCTQIFAVEGLAQEVEAAKEGDVDVKQVLESLNEPPKPQKLRFITSDAEIGGKLMAKEAKPLRDAIIGGVTGGILSAASVHPDANVTVLVMPYNPLLSDVRASIGAAQLIGSELLKAPLNVDFQPLQRKADRIEKKIKKALEQLTGQANLRSSKEHSMYL